MTLTTEKSKASRTIPQTDPHASYLAYQDGLDAAWSRVMQRGRYVLGTEVSAFEAEFANFVGAAHAVGTASGTASLELALRALGIAQEDRVITVSHTAVATASAIKLAGAEPLFVDIDPHSYTMDPNLVEDAIRNDRKRRRIPTIKAILPVHLYGRPADMKAICDIASRYDLRVVEDCAQAHGAAIDGRQVGCWGDIAAFSFYPTKNLGCFGDGGAIVTNSGDLARRCRTLREYGWDERRNSRELGINARLDELQAAILRVKLKHLDADNERRRAIGDVYRRGLQGSSIVCPSTTARALHVYHQFVVRCEQRDALRIRLAELGVATLVHYAVPVHQQGAFQSCAAYGGLKETERAVETILSLPMFPQLDIASARYVADCIVHSANNVVSSAC